MHCGEGHYRLPLRRPLRQRGSIDQAGCYATLGNARMLETVFFLKDGNVDKSKTFCVILHSLPPFYDVVESCVFL